MASYSPYLTNHIIEIPWSSAYWNSLKSLTMASYSPYLTNHIIEIPWSSAYWNSLNAFFESCSPYSNWR
ncbi:hypothetical protein JCM8547_004268 [Rhodosporidiobolus lusitaniae]